MTFTQKTWQEFVAHEKTSLQPFLTKHNLVLTPEQPHISGERFLMSGPKVVLLATNMQGVPYVIKTTENPESKKEIEAERHTNTILKELPFAYKKILSPSEHIYTKEGKRIIIVTEFIKETTPFLTLSLKKQFDLILGAFTMLAGAHATTASHQKITQYSFDVWDADAYKNAASRFVHNAGICSDVSSTLLTTLKKAIRLFNSNPDTITRYCGFLTHNDFVPHNFRFSGDAIYLIDQSSLVFGNKHESWARLMNYMNLHNPALERALDTFVLKNYASEEYDSLRSMRIYKLIELLSYHCNAVKTSSGDIQTLSKARVCFWEAVLVSIFENSQLQEHIRTQYIAQRNNLRSTAETARQKTLGQL
ncbi:MAG: hypothetical protein LR017_01635 [Candidatus Pacebacteria bacterium]|nr:hypothetical protein [Candidatus Paceibacterota bacterium]